MKEYSICDYLNISPGAEKGNLSYNQELRQLVINSFILLT